MKKAFLPTVLLLTLSVTSFAAKGPSVGGGGDVVVLPNDQVILADPYIDTSAPQPNNMPPLRALNPRILQAIQAYEKVSTQIIQNIKKSEKSDILDLINTLGKRENKLRFYGVKDAAELNNFCAPGGRKIYKLPQGYQVQQVACTAGEETFIVEPLFVKLTLRDQALLLIHERLTTLRDKLGGKNYSAIARFTTGLNIFLNIYQEQSKGKYRILTEDEKSKLTEFYIAIEELELRDSEVTEDSFQWIAHTNGGGRVHSSSTVEASATIDLRSKIGRNSNIGSNSKIINSNVECDAVLIGEKVNIINSSLSNIQRGMKDGKMHNGICKNIEIQDLTQIEDSRISTFANEDENNPGEAIYKIGKNVSIKNSSFGISNNYYELLGSLKIGDDVKINKLASNVINFETKNNVLIDNSKIEGTDSVLIAENEKLINKTINTATQRNFYPEGTTVSPVEMTFDIPQIELDDYNFGPERSNGKINNELLDSNGNGIILYGDYKYSRSTGVINRNRYYNLNLKLKAKYKCVAVSDELYMIDSNGQIKRAQCQKFVSVFSNLVLIRHIQKPNSKFLSFEKKDYYGHTFDIIFNPSLK